MRAVVVERLEGPEALVVRELPEPVARPGQVVVEVKAAGCNFSDVLMSRGEYQVKPPLPFVPGREASGTVCEVGEGVEGLAVGDRVFGFGDTGCFAERCVFEADLLHRMPDAMSFDDGAALPIVYPTSHAALVVRARLERGETLLVHAAAGGVGLAAVQIGRALGARVIATAGGPEKLEVAREAGAHVLVDYRREDFVERVLAETEGRGADVIYDSVGGETTDRSLKCIAWDGRLVVIGFASGDIPSIRANRIMLKNIAVTGLHWPAYRENAPDVWRQTFEALAGMVERGEVRPVVSARYPLERASEALAALAARATHGKVLITP